MANNETLKNRYEFTMLVEAKYCNPNGDPDMNNAPRVDSDTGIGYITDVAQKRWMRDYVSDAFAGEKGFAIHARKGSNLNRNIAEAVLCAPEKKMEPFQYMNEQYWDVRTFGGVLSTGLNAGQITGPVQLQFARSVDPIEVEEITITRSQFAEGKFGALEEYDKLMENTPEDKRRTMGTKAFTPFGLYVVRGTVSANLAKKTGFTEQDAEILWESILGGIENRISASKAGLTACSPLILFKHIGTQVSENEKQNEREALLGCAPAHKLFELLEVNRKADIEFPRDSKDYELKLNISSVPKGIAVGIKTSAFAPVEWNIQIGDRFEELEVI